MSINNLPKPGIGFKATLGPGSFKRKLSGATRFGDLKNLRDNQKAIIDQVKKYQGVIRTKGGLSRLQQRNARLKIKASDKTITKEDQREIREVLKALGRGNSAGAEKLSANKKLVKASDGKSFLTEKQIKRNLKVNMQRDESGLGLDSQRYKASFSGNVVSTKSVAVAETVAKAQKEIGAGRIGINTGPVGLATNYKNSKLPDNSLPKIPPAGVRPLGL